MKRFCEFKQIYTFENEEILKNHFPRLDDECYLDHAGTTLYSQEYINAVFKDLSSNLYGNPHTTNISSKSTKDAIDIVRLRWPGKALKTGAGTRAPTKMDTEIGPTVRILSWCNTSSQEYTVIFTSGATASLKLVGECFSYSNGGQESGHLCYLEESHTSVLGMREYADHVKPIPHSATSDLLTVHHSVSKKHIKNTNSLFVYPAQCNFSGMKYPLTWIENAKQGALNEYTGADSGNWFVLLDAAAFVPTNVLNLSKYKPDFVAISFYKVFGYPTGLGALLVRNSSKAVLNKRYYGGGTVQLAIASENFHIPKADLHERFEDGTLPFLSIISITHALRTIERININFYMISQHVFNLAQYLYRNLVVIHHCNGKRAAVIYSDTNYQTNENQGGIVTFNLLRSDGSYIGYSEVLHAANLYKIHLRTGCFCNPGACQRHLGLAIHDVYRHYEAGHVCGDQHDLVNGYPTGCVRVSFGYMSRKEDVGKLLNMIQECFIQKPVMLKIPSDWKPSHNVANTTKNEQRSKRLSFNVSPDIGVQQNSNQAVLEQIFLYPVKSCAAFKVQIRWEMSSTGLRYDRQWMIVNSAGVCVTQKQNKNLFKIQPVVDLQEEKLSLICQGFDQIDLPLNVRMVENESGEICQSKICGKIIQGWDCGDGVANWLDAVLDSSGFRLLRQFESAEDFPLLRNKNGEKLSMSLANKAQYLLVNKTSVLWLRDKMKSQVLEDVDSTIQRFRPNFVIDASEAFVENKAKFFSFDNLYFEATGKCTRCQVICLDQKTGSISKEPLITLSREMQGDISFGVYLKRQNVSRDFLIDVGSPVTIHFQ